MHGAHVYLQARAHEQQYPPPDRDAQKRMRVDKKREDSCSCIIERAKRWGATLQELWPTRVISS